jgi:hypothetical protein
MCNKEVHLSVIRISVDKKVFIKWSDVCVLGGGGGGGGVGGGSSHNPSENKDHCLKC